MIVIKLGESTVLPFLRLLYALYLYSHKGWASYRKWKWSWDLANTRMPGSATNE